MLNDVRGIQTQSISGAREMTAVDWLRRLRQCCGADRLQSKGSDTTELLSIDKFAAYDLCKGGQGNIPFLIASGTSILLVANENDKRTNVDMFLLKY